MIFTIISNPEFWSRVLSAISIFGIIGVAFATVCVIAVVGIVDKIKKWMNSGKESEKCC